MSPDAVELSARTFPLIFAAPSGAGKTTIARALGRRRRDVEFSISATTRAPRSYEKEGVDYYFKGEAEFRRMIAAGELLEWAEVHGHLYGTPRRNHEEALARGRFLVLDIDVQGSRQVKESVPEAVSVFVLPPSGDELARRLLGRGTEPPEVQERRLRAARAELAAALEFDYVIVNRDLQRSVLAVEEILAVEGRRTARLASLEDAVRRLDGQVERSLRDRFGGAAPHP